MRFLLALFLFAVCMANADEFRPAYLEIRNAANWAQTVPALWPAATVVRQDLASRRV